MKKIVNQVIGVMSGTSLDGIDLAHIVFIKNNTITYQILEHETISYPKEWQNQLKNAIHFSDKNLEDLNIKYTLFLGQIIKNFIEKHQLENTIDYVASHGHTIKHQPHKGITLQIGNLKEISNIIKKTVVCDFRVQDVMLGGQGAPLVPIGDEILFNEYDYCLNLGGFSNISTKSNGKRIAFDISPVNIVLNHYCNQLGFDYDDKGNFAASGKWNKNLFNQLNANIFYSKKPPKSLGLEFVQKEIIPLIDSFNIDVKEILFTFVNHIAFQISQVIQENKSLLITGGGVYNDFLIENIQKYAPKIKIIIPDSKTIEFKEALLFGLLGFLKMNNEINVLSSYTGASKDHSSGKIFKYKKT
jgi:anhydro-N-acetylmuramic acid kinase